MRLRSLSPSLDLQAAEAPRLGPEATVFLRELSKVEAGRDFPGAVPHNAGLAHLMEGLRDRLGPEGPAFGPSTPDFPSSRAGIDARGVLEGRLAASDLALEAATRALQHGSVDRATIRLVVVASVTSDRVVPSLAATLQHRLGLPTVWS